MKQKLRYLSIGIFLTLVWACQVDSNCNSINLDYVTFRTVTLDANGLERPRFMKFDSVVSPDADQVLLSRDSILAFTLPLNAAKDTTAFYFYYGDEVDSIRFAYEKIKRVDSPECGIDMEFVGLDTVYQSFDSMVIVNDTLRRPIGDADSTNIKLYFL